MKLFIAALSIILSACAVLPTDWLFVNQSSLKHWCHRSPIELVEKGGFDLIPITHRWATHQIGLKRERILLRFDANRLVSFEAFFDIEGRFASASLGQIKCKK
jgi:hypothetical protein